MDIIAYEWEEEEPAVEKIFHWESLEELKEYMKSHPHYILWHDEPKDILIISKIVLA